MSSHTIPLPEVGHRFEYLMYDDSGRRVGHFLMEFTAVDPETKVFEVTARTWTQEITVDLEDM